MTDPRKPPPPRMPRPEDGDLFRVEEDSPPTDRVPLPLPPPQRLPAQRPVDLSVHRGRGPSYVEIAAQLSATQQTVAGVAAAQAETLATQRKQSLQLDGFGRLINARFDIFHKELSLLRATVTGDHGPRLEKSERAIEQTDKAIESVKKATAAQKAATAATGTGLAAVIGLGVPLLAQLLPQYGDLIRALARWTGLQ